jgi:carotenoid cleavage dioxygenase-like enzyme
VLIAGPHDPLCVMNIVSPDGSLSQDYVVPISRGQMMHDFAITENYAVFFDSSIVFDLSNMIQDPRCGMPFRNDTDTPSRVVIVDRTNPEVTHSVEVRPFSFFHTANAWEEGTPGQADHVVNVVLCRCELAAQSHLVALFFDALVHDLVPLGFMMR